MRRNKGHSKKDSTTSSSHPLTSSTFKEKTIFSAKNGYFLFLALRMLFITSPGFIHVDEHIQNPEITAMSALQIKASLPWEFDPSMPARTIVIPFLTTGIPFLVMNKILPEPASPLLLLVISRSTMFILSIACDWMLFQLLRDSFIPIPLAWQILCLASSSLVTLSFAIRPFSNSVESFLLLCCLWIMFSKLDSQVKRHQNDSDSVFWTFLLGSLFSLGVFTRITFVAFGFPVGTYFLWITMKRSRTNSGQKNSCFLFIKQVLPLITGVLITAGLIIIIDSIYFEHLYIIGDNQVLPIFSFFTMDISKKLVSLWNIKGSFVVTPWNNFKYNADVENLKEHGLHPWFFHLLVNFPLLYGPLVFVTVKEYLSRWIQQHRFHFQSSSIKLVCFQVLLTSLICLSLFPHQEARFLVPCLFPLLLCLTNVIKRIVCKRNFWILWLVWNISISVIYNCFHQSGAVELASHLKTNFVLSSCAFVKEDSCIMQSDVNWNVPIAETLADVYLFKTFPIPHYLIGQTLTSEKKNKVVFHDVVGYSKEQLFQELLRHKSAPFHSRLLQSGIQQDGDKRAVFYRNDITSELFKGLFLVLPGFINVSEWEGELSLVELKRHCPSINFDYKVEIIQGFPESACLILYQVYKRGN